MKRYYCYALFQRSFLFLKEEELELVPFDYEFNYDGYLYTGSWLDMFDLFLPNRHEASLSNFIIKHTSVTGERVQIKTSLNDEEQKLISLLFQINKQ